MLFAASWLYCERNEGKKCVRLDEKCLDFKKKYIASFLTRKGHCFRMEIYSIL
jgi:hypothetical protein